MNKAISPTAGVPWVSITIVPPSPAMVLTSAPIPAVTKAALRAAMKAVCEAAGATSIKCVVVVSDAPPVLTVKLKLQSRVASISTSLTVAIDAPTGLTSCWPSWKPESQVTRPVNSSVVWNSVPSADEVPSV